MASEAVTAKAEWSWADNKSFEDALVKFPEHVPNRWQMIAGCLPGKSPHDVIVHYNALLQDIADIEAGLVQLPPYSDLPKTDRTSPPSGAGGLPVERKKGKPWTLEEHMLFLRGLKIYGKSDWRSISRNVVITRLPSQVASHAQKYFNRQKSGTKERKRSSIHDITSVSDFNPAYNTDSGSPYTTTNNAYPSTKQLPYNASNTSKEYTSTELLPYTTNNALPSTEKSYESLPYTTNNAFLSTEVEKSFEILPYTTNNAFPSTEKSSEILPYTTNNAFPSTEKSSEILPYTTNNANAFPSTEQSAYTTSMAYPSTQNLPYTTSKVYPEQSADQSSFNLYPSTEQCSLPYNTSNVYLSTELAFGDINNIGTAVQDDMYLFTESSPSSMDCLPFEDINNIGTAVQDQTDAVVPVPNPYIPESYALDYSFEDFHPFQM